jgi:hypothetical protein
MLSPLLPLLLASFLAVPQQAPGSVPTAADSTWVRELLEAAEEELATLPAGVGRATVGRVGREWAEWGDHARGAALISRASAEGPVGPFTPQQEFQAWISLSVGQYLRGDTALARRGEAALTDEGREAFRGELVDALLSSGRLAEADSLIALIASPLTRATAILRGTRIPDFSGLTTDEVIAWLSEEAERLEGMSDGEVPNARLYIQGRLLDLGVELTPAAVSTSLTPRQAQRNLTILAEQLQARGRREEAAAFLDSALRIAEARSDMRQLESMATRAQILEVRRAPGDSARAASLRDSIASLAPVRRPVQGPVVPARLEAMYEALRLARREDDLSAIQAQLAAMDAAGYSLEALREAASTAFELSRRGYDMETRSAVPPRLSELRSLLSSAWSFGARLEPASRDSARLVLMMPWLALGSEEALPNALEIETVRYRERAIASLVSSLDLERAARLVAGFTDAEARNRAFSQLSREYLRAGQISLAEAAAERTVSGDARVWALGRVADARWNAGDSSGARTLIQGAIVELGDEALCEGDCEIVVYPGQPPPPRTSPPSLLAPVIAVSYLVGERDALEAWARTRSDADARARAYVRIAEIVRRLHDGTRYDRTMWGAWAASHRPRRGA